MRNTSIGEKTLIGNQVYDTRPFQCPYCKFEIVILIPDQVGILDSFSSRVCEKCSKTYKISKDEITKVTLENPSRRDNK